MPPIPLTNEQEKLVRELTGKIQRAGKARDFKAANDAFITLSFLLVPLQQTHRLHRTKLLLFRTALDSDESGEIEDNLRKSALALDWNTPEWLEANSLLAILYLKLGKFEDAKSYIRMVLENEHVLHPDKRDKFHDRFIDRIGEEAILFTLKPEGKGKIDEKKMEIAVMKLLLSERNEEDIAMSIAENTPIKTARTLYLIEAFAREVATGQTIALPDMESQKGKVFIGKKIFNAFTRRAHAALCNPESQVNKIWVEKGVGALFGGKSTLAAALASAFSRYDIAIFSLAVPVTALIVKTGIEAICDVTSGEAV